MRKETIVTTMLECRRIDTDDKTKTVEVTQSRSLRNRKLKIVINNLIKDIKTWLRKHKRNDKH